MEPAGLDFDVLSKAEIHLRYRPRLHQSQTWLPKPLSPAAQVRWEWALLVGQPTSPEMKSKHSASLENFLSKTAGTTEVGLKGQGHSSTPDKTEL